MSLSSSSTQEEKNAHYRAALTAYTEALTARDPDAILKLFAAGATLEDPVGSGRFVNGIDALRPYFILCLRARYRDADRWPYMLFQRRCRLRADLRRCRRQRHPRHARRGSTPKG